MIELVDIYLNQPGDCFAAFLYKLLAERKVSESISHKHHPTWEQHKAFVQSKPYLGWYVIADDDELIGTCYITKYREVGIWLMPSAKGKGAGKAAMRQLLAMYPGRVFTNTSLYNDGAKAFYEKMGFRHCANMLEHDNLYFEDGKHAGRSDSTGTAEQSAIHAQEMVDGWKGKPLAGCSDSTGKIEQHTVTEEGFSGHRGYAGTLLDPSGS